MKSFLITGADQEARMLHALIQSKLALCLEKNSLPCDFCENCTRIEKKAHPNIHIVEPAGANEEEFTNEGTIKIEQIRSVIEEHSKANFEQGPAIFLITHMHFMTKNASNALLKVIENGSAHKFFLCLAPSKRSIPATVASRLIEHRLRPTLVEPQNLENKINLISKIISLKPQKRFSEVSKFPTTKRELLIEVDSLLVVTHHMLRKFEIDPKVALLLSDSLFSMEKALRRNANPRLAIEDMLFNRWPYRS